jgi:glycosyltransferase involved in cell wall biosynthesis
LIGLGLKKAIPSLKWVADFRDPWSELDLLDEFHLSNSSRKKHQYLEKQVLKSADVTLTVSESWVKSFKNLGSNNVKLITNGFDEDDFDVRNLERDKFILGHFGLLNHLRNPKNLWKTLNDLCDEIPDFNEKLEIRLSGNIDAEVISEIESHSYLKIKVKQLGYLSHAEVLAEYNEASVLLLLLFNSKSGIGNYPGKIFEYFAAKRSILAFGPEDSDAEKLIAKTKTGMYFSYDKTNLKDDILDLFKNQNQFNFENIESFSRERLTKDLSDLLTSIN